MSAAATFWLPRDVDVTGLLERLRAVWSDLSVDVVEEGDHVMVQACYYYGSSQDAEVRRVAETLLEAVGDRPLFYLRDNDGCGLHPPEFWRVVSTAELSSPDFHPAMHNGPHYKYRLTPASSGLGTN
jgi:hypothetical protein